MDETDTKRNQQGLILVLGVLVAFAANTALAWGIPFLAVPLYLDSLLTFVVVKRWGLLSGVVVAVATNAALAALSITLFPLVLCHILTVLGAWLV